MSPKSRRKFNKYSGQRRNPPSTIARSQVTSTTPEAKVQTGITSRSTEPRASAAAVASYANVSRELKTIGIIAGISLAVLIVLGIILS